jgi:hypothetical protein
MSIGEQDTMRFIWLEKVETMIHTHTHTHKDTNQKQTVTKKQLIQWKS